MSALYQRQYWLVPLLTTLFILRVGVFSSVADVRLPKVIADHMVWQRNVPIIVWGWADPGESVTVQFASQQGQTKAGPDGQWKVQLEPFTAGGSYLMTVQGRNKATVRNILIGVPPRFKPAWRVAPLRSLPD